MRHRSVAAETAAARSEDLFRFRLENLVDGRHPLIRLAQRMPWAALEDALQDTLPPAPVAGGRPALPVRLMAGLLYLKHAYDLSDEAVCERWLENPYWQCFTGEVFFQTTLPCDPSSLVRWRTILGRLLRDVQRQLAGASEAARAAITPWLERAERLHRQRPKDKDKLYALHAPEVECIGKGKARQPYEFGVKVGLAITARQGLIVGARSFPGNPYDGDTLQEQLEQVECLTRIKPQTAIVDLGFRGREIEGTTVLHRGKAKRLTRSQWRWVKRRQAIEPIIGHVKDDCGMRRCALKGAQGDAHHAVLCAAGYNFRWLLRWIAVFVRLIRHRLTLQDDSRHRSNAVLAPCGA